MAGLYIHIPFCKQACHYCNFHFSTSLKYKDALINALLKEIELQQDYLGTSSLDSIYLGGGTPSLLTRIELEKIFNKINEYYTIHTPTEITLECNPDDLDLEKLSILRDTAINRLSIGVQSFFDEDLSIMNRAHNQKQAHTSIENAIKYGFENLTIDLMYGLPNLTNEKWEKNLAFTFDYNIPHISCYSLTVEEGTALQHFVKNKKIKILTEETTAHQFELLMAACKANDYIHYEISNFAKQGRFAIHNSNYWKSKKYLGIGPSAHSYNGHSRQWNINNNALYINALKESKLPFTKENLSKAQQYNEYILTSLRTIWGCNIEKIRKLAPSYEPFFLKMSNPYISKGLILKKGDNYVLSPEGKLLSDSIALDLFLDE